MKRKLVIVLGLVFLLVQTLTAENASADTQTYGHDDITWTWATYAWVGYPPCVTESIEIQYKLTLGPHSKVRARWEHDVFGPAAGVEYRNDRDTEFVVNIHPSYVTSAKASIVNIYAAELAYNIYNPDITNFPGKFKVSDIVVTVQYEPGPCTTPLPPGDPGTPPPMATPYSGPTPTLQNPTPNPALPTPNPTPTPTVTPPPGAVCVMPMPSGVYGPPGPVDCDEPGAVPLSPSPTPEEEEPVCSFDVSGPIPGYSDTNAGLPLCYPGDDYVLVWEHASSACSDGNWKGGLLVDSYTGASYEGAGLFDTAFFGGYSGCVGAGTTYVVWGGYPATVPPSCDPESERVFAGAIAPGTIVTFYYHWSTSVTGTMHAYWALGEDMCPCGDNDGSTPPDQAPENDDDSDDDGWSDWQEIELGTDPDDPDSHPANPVEPEPTDQPCVFGPGACGPGQMPDGMPSDAGNIQAEQGLGTVAVGCEPTYPKPGQVAMVDTTQAPPPPDVVGIPIVEQLFWIGSWLGEVPDMIRNFGNSSINTVIDLVFPSDCFPLIFEGFIERVKLLVPFSWLVEASDVITAALEDVGDEGIPQSLEFMGRTIPVGSSFDMVESMLSPFRFVFVALLYLRFAMFLFSEALAFAGRRNEPQQQTLWGL